MLHRFLPLCLAVAISGSGLVASADQPVPQHLAAAAGTEELTHEDAPFYVVAHKRLLDRIATWTDAPAECLFDRGDLATEEAKLTAPALPIARMLNAKCYVYCPSEERPIEAIYRERLANHGVKVIPIESPSKRGNEAAQKRLLIAKLQ